MVAACSPAPVDAGGVPVREVRPAGVSDPAHPPSEPLDTGCDDPRASLRPDGPLPPPGAMPAGSTMAAIVARGWLVAGVNQNAYRVGHRDPDTGDLVGFEIDIVRAMAQALFGDPDRVKYTAIDASDREAALRDGRVDLVIRTMTMTCAAWRSVDFSTEYYTAHQRLLVPVGSGVAEIEDLSGQKVCAAEGSTSLANIVTFNPAAIPVSTQDVVDCLVLLQQHQVAAVSTSDILLVALAAQDPQTRIVGRHLRDQPYGVAVAKSAPDLVKFVNGVLERIRGDGTWTASHSRWLSGELGSPSPPPPVARYR
jgi:polar amino acid transport system substrate-binding protein